MSNRLNLLAAATVACLALVGCNRSDQPTAENQPAEASANASETAAPLAEPLKSPGGMITATPGSVPSCDSPAIVKLAWAVTGRTDVQNVNVMAGAEADAKTFAAGGATGEAETGPWVTPGAVFVLRNATDGAELDRITIGGPACVPPAPSDNAPASGVDGVTPAPESGSTDPGTGNAPAGASDGAASATPVGQ